MDWTYKNNRFFHIPCKSYAYPERIYQPNSIKCDKCKKKLPEELEFPSQVFKADRESKWMYEPSYFYINVTNLNNYQNPIYFSSHQSNNPDRQKEE